MRSITITMYNPTVIHPCAQFRLQQNGRNRVPTILPTVQVIGPVDLMADHRDVM